MDDSPLVWIVCGTIASLALGLSFYKALRGPERPSPVEEYARMMETHPLNAPPLPTPSTFPFVEVVTPAACRSCRWWDGSADDRQVERAKWEDGPDHNDCRRRAPVYGKGPGSSTTVWPKTDAEDWCGDFQRIATPEPIEPPALHTTTRAR